MTDFDDIITKFVSECVSTIPDLDPKAKKATQSYLEPKVKDLVVSKLDKIKRANAK